MISSRYVSRVSLLRDKVDTFYRYPFSLPAIREFDRIDLHPKVTFFVGANGSGKSTLLEAIAVGLGFNRVLPRLADEALSRRRVLHPRRTRGGAAVVAPARYPIAYPRSRAEGSQFITATHSPLLMAYPDAAIFQCGRGGIHAIACEETEHFRITRDFLKHRKQLLQAMFVR